MREVQFTRSVMSDSLRPHGLQHARLPCPSPTPRACSNSWPSSRWCHPTILTSVVSFSSWLQSFPASGSFPVSQFFASGGQIGASALASVVPMNIQDWFPLGWTGWISLQFRGLSRVFSNESALRMRWPKYWSFSFSMSPSNEYSELISFRIDWFDLVAVQETLKSLLQHHSTKASILWHSAFFIVQLSHPYTITRKTIALTRRTCVAKVMSLLFNVLSKIVIAFLPRSKCLLILWLQSPSAVILECKKIKVCHCFPICLPWSDGTGCHNLSFFECWVLLSFKSAFSLSSFTFIKRLFSSSLLSVIRVVSCAYLRLWIFLSAILIPACASSSLAFHMMYSAYKLTKQDDNIQPWHTPFPIWIQSIVPCPVLAVASWLTFRFLRRQVMWSVPQVMWSLPISWRIFQFVMRCTQSKILI